MKKFFVGTLAVASLAGGSMAIATVNPFGIASADTGTIAVTPTTPTTPGAATGKAVRNNTRLDDALKSLVADGTLTQAQADTVKARLLKALPMPGGMRGHFGRGGGPSLDAAATFLGTTATELRTKLEGGQTLAQIAGSKTADLIKNLTDAANAKIDAAVTAGKLTADRAATAKTNTTQRITDFVNGTRPLRGRGMHPAGGTPPALPPN